MKLLSFKRRCSARHSRIKARSHATLQAGVSLAITFVLTTGFVFAQDKFDAAQLAEHVRFLASDSLQGRKTGTPGNQIAREYIEAAFAKLALEPFGGSYQQPFIFENRREQGKQYEGVNLLGRLKGQSETAKYIVVSAHYDHLGVRNGEIYNGADDNASGVGALLAAASYFRKNVPQHTLIFAAFDAEEMGLQGAKAFVADPPVAIDSIVLNVNLDMVSRGDKNELYVAGTSHYPALKPFVEAAAKQAKIEVRYGHDTKGEQSGYDWTFASDHGPFHRAEIPFIYFGVEDHPDYHKPTDDFEKIDMAFFVEAVNFIIDAIAELDSKL